MIATILVIIITVLAWIGAYVTGKSKAETQAKAKEADVKVAVAEKTAEVETEVLKKANHVQNETVKTSDTGIADGMRDKYTRD